MRVVASAPVVNATLAKMATRTAKNVVVVTISPVAISMRRSFAKTATLPRRKRRKKGTTAAVLTPAFAPARSLSPSFLRSAITVAGTADLEADLESKGALASGASGASGRLRTGQRVVYARASNDETKRIVQGASIRIDPEGRDLFLTRIERPVDSKRERAIGLQ